MAGANLTLVDLQNASNYSYELSNLAFLAKFRKRFPNIPINYDIKSAVNDFYVPEALRDRGIVATITFSSEGCEQINCYPFSETVPMSIDTPFSVTQTSETPVFYGQPACYNLDLNEAMTAEGDKQIQSVETRYHKNRCIMMDSLVKYYLNAPYIRTQNHLQRGIDTVPGFDISYNPNDAYPETFVGAYNSQYCDNFARSLIRGKCEFRWWENIVGSVLGESILATFKGFVREITGSLKSHDFRRPHHNLPQPPRVDPQEVHVKRWQDVRDTKVDAEFEASLADIDNFSLTTTVNIELNQIFSYRANIGSSVKDRTDLTLEELPARLRVAESVVATADLIDEASFEDMLANFINDHLFLSSIVFSVGFDVLNDALKALLKKAATKMIPAMQRALLRTTATVTRKLMLEAFKAAMVTNLTRFAVKIVSSVAKAIARFGVMASSVIGLVLIFFAIADIVLMFWDPFGYNNMFPKEFLVDIAYNFLAAFYDNAGTRDVIEIVPRAFEHYIPDDDEEEDQLMGFMLLLEYVSELTVNSDGQLLELRRSNPLTEEDLEPNRLSKTIFNAIDMKSYEDLLKYSQNMNRLVGIDPQTLQRPSDTLSRLLAPTLGTTGLILALLPTRYTIAVDILPLLWLVALLFGMSAIMVALMNRLETFPRLYYELTTRRVKQ